MNLEKRVDDLERIHGANGGKKVIVVGFVGCDRASPTSGNRVIEPSITGYTNLSGEQRWALLEGEAPEDCRKRAVSEVKANARGVFVLLEEQDREVFA